jgi:hypothetical protein
MFKFLNSIKCRVIYLVYSALALIILFPLLKSGYIFAMDMVFTPYLRWPEPFNVPGAFLYLLNFILPSQIIQKILLFLILFLSGVGMHRLIPNENELPKYFAGIFYIFNPFVYSHFLFGQFWLLMAYALMPFVVKSIFEFLNIINFRNALRLSFWFVLVGYISVHFIVFVFLFFAIAFLVFLFKTLPRREPTCPVARRKRWYGEALLQGFKEKKEIFRIFKYTLLIFLIFFILSSWWILPYFNKVSPQGQFLQEAISQKDFEAFKTESDAQYGVLLNVAALYGFWGDRMDQYILPKDVMPYWFLLFFIILALVIFGMIDSFKKNKFTPLDSKHLTGFIAITFIIVAVIAFILSVGISYQPFVSLINFFNEKIFIFKGFRDSQKFSALLVLVYSYFGALGINAILKNSPKESLRDPTGQARIQKLKNLKVIFATFFIALPVLYLPLMVWGFCGQLYTSHYPQEWFEVNEILNQDKPPRQNIGSGGKEDFKVLFFPWHQYMPFSFIENKVVANPASQFFNRETIAGDNMEIGVYTHSKRPISRLVEDIVLRRIQGIENFGEVLAPFNVKYIILAKEADWLEYKFLDIQRDLEPIFDSKYLRIYQNKSWSNLPR